ncbi:MAG: hypothetical protein P1P64_07120, partial [Treponemataceae bacterium]
MNKHINNYTAKDYWIRFLANYKNDTKTEMIKSLCEKNKPINSATERTSVRERAEFPCATSTHYNDATFCTSKT